LARTSQKDTLRSMENAFSEVTVLSMNYDARGMICGSA